MSAPSEPSLPHGRASNVTVFVSDPTAEAERVSQALRAAGFQVFDVPLSMLVARVAVQRPHVVIVDADSDGAILAIARMREVPECDAVDVLFLGRRSSLASYDDASGGELSGIADALAFESSGFFSRPVESNAVVRKVRALALGTAIPSSIPPSHADPPPSLTEIPARPSSLAPPSRRSIVPPAAPRRSDPPSPRISHPPPSVGRAGPLSRDLERLLAEAEGRLVGQAMSFEGYGPTPEEELESVLPAGVLEALDAPLEHDDDDDADLGEAGPRRVTTSSGGSHTTGAHSLALTRGTSTSAGASEPSGPAHASITHAATSAPSNHEPDAPTGSHAPEAPLPTHDDTSRPPERSTAPIPEEARAGALKPARDEPAPFVQSEAPPQYGRIAPRLAPDPPQRPAAQSAASVVLESRELLSALAQAIVRRSSGVLSFESTSGRYDVVLREGDIVTAASTADEDGLVAFLAARGDLPRERAALLQGRLTGQGRHAGAALVAQGLLRQDDLWGVLRAHAEWVLTRALAAAPGAMQMAAEAAGRLRSEPSVFGGSTGAEVFVDIVRRTVDSASAGRALGGSSSRIADGSNAGLLAECALDEHERGIFEAGRGESLAALASAHPEVDLLPLAYALSMLHVIEVIRAVAPRPPSIAPGPADAEFDLEAVRERIRARLALVDEGDYFAVLGVGRNATGYEIRRAFLELRREFEPARMLSPGIVELGPDVRRIVAVLEEAFEILGDAARRERYRRAIEATPG